MDKKPKKKPASKKKTSSKASPRKSRSKSPVADETPESPDDVLDHYDGDGQPVWVSPDDDSQEALGDDFDQSYIDGDETDADPDGDAWPEDAEPVDADALVQDGAQDQNAPPREYRMHPAVAKLVDQDHRFVPMVDYNEERPYTELLPVELTEAELHALGDEISELLERERRLIEENKQIKKELSQAEAKLHSEILSKNALKRDGREHRKVPVQSVAHLGTCQMHLVRGDTGEIVESRTRTMTASEIAEARQVRLPGVS